jgi:hypothetical protein
MRTTDRVHEILVTFFERLEAQRVENGVAIYRAQKKGADKAATAQVRKDGQQLERELMQKAVDDINAAIGQARAEACRKATAPMPADALHQLEALRLRGSVAEAEADALAARFGGSYQFMAALKDLLGAMGVPFSVRGGELQGYSDALDGFAEASVSYAWNATGDAKKDSTNLEGNWFLYRAFPESAIATLERLEPVWEGYE